MQIKRFEAGNMTQALRMVKKEFGADAVILSAKEIKPSVNLFGHGRSKAVEITAARDGALDENIAKMQNRGSNNNPQNAKPSHHKSINVSVSDAMAGTDASDTDRRAPLTYSRRNSGALPVISSDRKPSSISGASDPARIRRMAARNVAAAKQSINKKEPIPTAEDNSKDNSKDNIDQTLYRHKLTCQEDDTCFDSRKIMAFTGPSGVGKTTVIAKLATRFKTRLNKRVGIISTDGYRFAAVTELKAYSDIIGVPIETAWDKARLSQAVDSFDDMDVILIDTPGAGMKDTAVINEIAMMLVNGAAPDQVHLVINASIQEDDFNSLVRAYSPVPVNRLLITKIDETTMFSSFIGHLSSMDIPISYLGDGRDIYNDIHEATFEKICEQTGVARTFNNPLSRTDRTTGEKASAVESLDITGKTIYVANKNSELFHHKDCKSVKRINRENIIMFESMEDAKARFFRPCRMCCTVDHEIETLTKPFGKKMAGAC